MHWHGTLSSEGVWCGVGVLGSWGWQIYILSWQSYCVSCGAPRTHVVQRAVKDRLSLRIRNLARPFTVHPFSTLYSDLILRVTLLTGKQLASNYLFWILFKIFKCWPDEVLKLYCCWCVSNEPRGVLIWADSWCYGTFRPMCSFLGRAPVRWGWGYSDTSAPLPPRPLDTSAPSHLSPTTTSASVWRKCLVTSFPSHVGP